MTNTKEAIVRYYDQTEAISCPYGDVRRIVTAGEGGVANVHVVKVTEGGRHFHAAYDEVYYVLQGEGSITLGTEEHALRPGAVVVIPAGVPHALQAAPHQQLAFIIFGTPAVPVTSEQAKPRKA